MPSRRPPFNSVAMSMLSKGGLFSSNSTVPNSEEVIAEDYDEMEYPSQYENYEPAKRPEENFWIERMKLRIGDNNYAGFKGCPNKYNIYHKCTLFCVNRWEHCPSEPSREYMIRFRRLLKKYPLPKGWTQTFDMGCGSFYFWNTIDGSVSWLPPTHPKSQVSKSAAVLRRQLEEAIPIDSEDEDKSRSESESENSSDENDNSGHIKKPSYEISDKKIEQMLNASIKKPLRIPTPPVISVHTDDLVQRKPKSRDIEKTLQRGRIHNHKMWNRRLNKGPTSDSDPLDPMDPSAYSDIPRGKWSDGLNVDKERDRVSSQQDEPPSKIPHREAKKESTKKSDDEDND